MHLHFPYTRAHDSEGYTGEEAGIISHRAVTQNTQDAVAIEWSLDLRWQFDALSRETERTVTTLLLPTREIHAKVLRQGQGETFLSCNKIHDIPCALKCVLLLLFEVFVHLRSNFIKLRIGARQLLEDAELGYDTLGCQSD